MLNPHDLDTSTDYRETARDFVGPPETAVHHRPSSLSIERSYAHGWCGNRGIVAALCALATGRSTIARWAVMQHHTQGSDVARIATVGRGRDGSYRWCGEGHDPESAGSCLCGRDLLEAIAVVSHDLTVLGYAVYRLPT